MTYVTTRMHAEMRMMREMGTRYGDIAEYYGVSKSTVEHHCRGLAPVVPYDGAAIGRMWRAGMTAKEIARALDISEYQVRGYAKRHRDECPVRHVMRNVRRGEG